MFSSRTYVKVKERNIYSCIIFEIIIIIIIIIIQYFQKIYIQPYLKLLLFLFINYNLIVFKFEIFI